MNTVFGLFQADERRLFPGPRQGEQAEDSQGALGEDPRRNRDSRLDKLQFNLTLAIHVNLDSFHVGKNGFHGFFNGMKLSWVEVLERIEKRGQLFPHQADVANLLDRIGGPHSLPGLKIKKHPALQLVAHGHQVGVVGRIVGEGKDGMVEVPLVVDGMRLTFHPQVESFLLQGQKRFPFTGGFAFPVKSGQVFVHHPQNPHLGQDLDLQAIAQAGFTDSGDLVFRAVLFICPGCLLAGPSHIADQLVHLFDHRRGEFHVNLDTEAVTFCLEQALDSFGTKGKRFKWLAPVWRFKGLLEGPG